MPYDLIIIGGSAAAASAGVYAARRGLNALVLTESFGGEVATSGEIENWPGAIHTTGMELAGAFERHLRAQKIAIETGILVERVNKTGQFFTVTAKKDGAPNTREARAVIVATGVHPRELGVPGEKEFRGKGVSYCTVCDGPLFRGKTVAVVGGGNSANEAGIMLAALCPKVYVLTKNPAMKGEAVLLQKLGHAPNLEIIVNAATQKFRGYEVVKTLEYQDTSSGKTKQLAVDGVFIHIGMAPNSGLAPEAEKNAFGEIKVNQLCETNVPGLFAAGDVTDVPFKQIAIAAGQGVIAALEATRYLNSLAEVVEISE